MQRYKIKLKPGDYVFINNLKINEFRKVAQRFLDDGCKEVESINTNYSFWLYFGWRPCSGTFFSSGIDTYLEHYSGGTNYQYDQIMELAEPETSNDWHERGELPPVGTPCECDYSLDNDWVKGIISSHVYSEESGLQAIFQGDGFWCARGVSDKSFRPLNSDRQKAIEKALEHLPFVDSVGEYTLDFLGNLYDVGLLRLPEAE